MFFQTNLRAAVVSASVLLLVAGCANQGTTPVNEADKSMTTANALTTEVNSAPPVQVQTAPVDIPNPAIIEFDKMSVKLSDKAKEMIAQMTEKAEGSKNVVIWGFCDRTQIGNAEKSAIARGVAVRKELQANGVKSPKFRIRYSTEKPNRHAAEVHFD